MDGWKLRRCARMRRMRHLGHIRRARRHEHGPLIQAMEHPRGQSDGNDKQRQEQHHGHGMPYLRMGDIHMQNEVTLNHYHRTRKKGCHQNRAERRRDMRNSQPKTCRRQQHGKNETHQICAAVGHGAVLAAVCRYHRTDRVDVPWLVSAYHAHAAGRA